MTLWSFGAANLGAPAIARAVWVTVAITTAVAFQFGWRVEGSNAATSMAPQTTTVTTSSKDPVHINDMNATILHCMGIDHERFTFKFQGLNTRLTGVEEAHVAHQILA
jgi:hypothetical protein